ncbi:excisionase family DNA binding protein [Microbacterium sp. AK009]|uniref:helix-turn-helix domain-containing protein n=1 Tax=Microbacterium sp. AK009 TaxID=2723068 RepID=UPI0015C70250|nr:excisionase family DNA binding protein [Microbacterium sp. AK009]
MDSSRTSLPVLLTPEDLADYLNVSLRTIEGWRLSRKGPAYVRMGKHVRYRADRVESWLGERAV